MQPLVIVYFMDKKGKPNLNIFQALVFPEIDFLALEGFEKALGGSVVVGIAFARHADPKENAFGILSESVIE